MKPLKWKPVDVVVVMLAGTVCLAILVSILTAAIKSEELTSEKTKTLASVTVATISIISIYVGARIKSDNEKGED